MILVTELAKKPARYILILLCQSASSLLCCVLCTEQLVALPHLLIKADSHLTILLSKRRIR